MHRLAIDERGHAVDVPGQPPLLAHGAKHADVVVPEVSRVVVVFAELDAFRRQHVAEGGEVQRFAVGDHAVEVEDDGSDHVPIGILRPLTLASSFFRRSPARTGICRWFSRGDIGHS